MDYTGSPEPEGTERDRTMTQKARIAILGASGYTGAELVRLIATHPGMEIAALTADRKAGETMGSVFPHLRHLDLPTLCRIEDVDAGHLIPMEDPEAVVHAVEGFVGPG